MSSVGTGIIVLVCVFGGALLGMFLRTVLPKHHLESETKDVVKLGMGLVGTMAALILGLLVTSAKGNYDAQSAELTQVSANILVLDRVLSHYGPETNEAREALKVAGGSRPRQNVVTNPPGAISGGFRDTPQRISLRKDSRSLTEGRGSAVAEV